MPRNGRPAKPRTMTTSPAWLSIALTTLSTVPEDPSKILESGTRILPSPHILNHLNRWARHVWRPAVSPRSLSALTNSPTKEPLTALGTGPLTLLCALVDAIRRCQVSDWLDVLGVMFLADDPWVVEVGRKRNTADVDRSSAALRALYETPDLLTNVSHALTERREESADALDEGAMNGEGFAELRCRVAALQLQLDDVTEVVRRNEKNTKDLLSSFHFWSLLLLDELRSYKSTERAPDGSSSTEGMLESMSRRMGQIVNRPTGGVTGSASETSGESSGKGDNDARAREKRPARRIFRDGKWVEL